MPLMISRIGHARGRPAFFAAGRWGAIAHHSLSVPSVWYRFVSGICCIRVVGVHMGSPGLVSATPWNHADASHSTSFETASKDKRWGTLARFLTVAWAGNTILVLTFLQLGLLIKYLQPVV